MTSTRDDFKEFLRAHGQSVTKSRVAVFEALLGQEPMSMHALVARVPGADRASVYRAVDLFERLGIVQRLNSGWKYKLELSDKFAAHHHHLTCVECGRTVPMHEVGLEDVIDRLAQAHGFRPVTHQIEIQGVCGRCLENSTS